MLLELGFECLACMELAWMKDDGEYYKYFKFLHFFEHTVRISYILIPNVQLLT